MAEKLDISKNDYAKLERGETKINTDHIKKIVSGLNIDVAELFKESKNFNLQLVGDNSCHNHQINGTKDEQTLERLTLIIAHKDELLTYKDELLKQKETEIDLLKQLLTKTTA